MRPKKQITDQDRANARELKLLKGAMGLTWEQIYRVYVANGGKRRYSNGKMFGPAVAEYVIKDLECAIEPLKAGKVQREVKVTSNRKAKTGRKRAWSSGRRVAEPTRIVRAYAKENGVFGLQREYLE